MPKLFLTNTKGKRHSINLVTVSNRQQPNEVQMRELEQIQRRLPSHILAEMSANGLNVHPRDFGLLLSRLKGAEDSTISIGE